MVKKETEFLSLFAMPLMRVQLDFDLEKLTEFAFQLQNKDEKGMIRSNEGGWHSNDIREEKHEEFIRLTKEINQYLQIYHSNVFRGVEFKGNVIHGINEIWINISEKQHYNEWHVHPMSTISGAFYVKHDGSSENGDIVFKNPIGIYMTAAHWPNKIVEKFNEITAPTVNILPKSNTLFLFPSWLEHKVEPNSKNDTRISLSFNTEIILEEKS